jgi:hypothetical protein
MTDNPSWDYQTYYIPSSGQPRCCVEYHCHIGEAANAWRANIAGLLAHSGGESVLVKTANGDRLRWVSGPGDCYVTGEMADEDLADRAGADVMQDPDLIAKWFGAN